MSREMPFRDLYEKMSELYGADSPQADFTRKLAFVEACTNAGGDFGHLIDRRDGREVGSAVGLLVGLWALAGTNNPAPPATPVSMHAYEPANFGYRRVKLSQPPEWRARFPN